MKLIKAKRLGFCSGVKRAIHITNQSLEQTIRPVQFLGSLVHNELVVKKFLAQGVVFLEKPSQMKKGVLIIQAHGFRPLGYKKKGVIVKDATCPLVKKVQRLASCLEKQGHRIIMLGNKNHAEIKGIQGHLKKKMTVIADKKQVVKIRPGKSGKIAFICQTTQNAANFGHIAGLLKKKCDSLKIFDTICPEVKARQQAAKTVIGRAKTILLVGSRKSANTRELYLLAKKTGKKVIWINSCRQIKNRSHELFKKTAGQPWGILSGTSADNAEIKKIISFLESCL